MRWEFSVLAEGRAQAAGHYKALTETGNRTRKVSGTQGSNLLALVVQKMDSAIYRISIRETNCTIQWIVIYSVDSTIHLSNN